MFAIDTNNRMRIPRGDTGYFSVDIKKYEIQDGDTLTFTVKANPDDANTIIKKTLSAIDTTTFTILPSDTAGQEVGRYFYDVQLTTTLGEVYTIIECAPFLIKAEVSE